MKAMVAIAAEGGAQLRFQDHPDPQLGPGDVIVKVGAAAINHSDIWLKKGLFASLPLVPGLDAAGTVVDVAVDVTDVRIGARVILNPAVTCDACAYCYAGDHGTCRSRKGLGQQIDGSYAEYVKVPWRNVHEIRSDLAFEEAAAVPTAFFTAWQLLTLRAGLKPDQTVLIMAAASGVGSAAVQIAKLLGARVIGAASSDLKLDRIRSWGADETINYLNEDFGQRVLDLTNGEGVEVIADPIGASNWPGYLKCLRAGGRLVTCGMAGGTVGELSLEAMIRRQITVMGCGPQGSKSEARKVVSLINRGLLKGVVDKVFPLADAEVALAVIEDRDVIGKIILKP